MAATNENQEQKVAKWKLDTPNTPQWYQDLLRENLEQFDDVTAQKIVEDVLAEVQKTWLRDLDNFRFEQEQRAKAVRQLLYRQLMAHKPTEIQSLFDQVQKAGTLEKQMVPGTRLAQACLRWAETIQAAHTGSRYRPFPWEIDEKTPEPEPERPPAEPVPAATPQEIALMGA